MKCFIHIGMEKTGTTTIQNFFSCNRNLLLKNGILYPLSPGRTLQSSINHIKLTACILEANKNDSLQKMFNLKSPQDVLRFRNKFKQDLKHELNKTTAKTVIFSNENCSSRLTTKEEINSLKNLLIDFFDDIQIIIYLRRQDEFLMSSYSTKVKCGSETQDFSLPGEELIRRRYDYWNIIKKWESIFCKENIIVKIFEREQMLNGDLLDDFTSIVGLQTTKDYIIPDKKNPSLDIHCLNFLKNFNKFTPRFIDNKVNNQRGNIVNLLESYSSNNYFKISEEAANQFMLNFIDSNNLVAKHYLNRSDGKLFSRKISKFSQKNSNYHEDESLEKMFEIFAYLWAQKQHELLQQKEYMVSGRMLRIVKLIKYIVNFLNIPRVLIRSLK